MQSPANQFVPSVSAQRDCCGSVLSVLREKWHVIVLAGVLCGFVGGFLCKGLWETYTAYSNIVVRPNEETLQGDAASVKARVYAKILRSRTFAEKVTVEENLFQIAEFGGVAGALDFYELDKVRQEKIIDKVLSRLDASVYDKSDIIKVSFRSENPVLAADVVNRLVMDFIDSETAKSREEARFTLKAVTERVDDLAEQVRQIENEVGSVAPETDNSLSGGQSLQMTSRLENSARSQERVKAAVEGYLKVLQPYSGNIMPVRILMKAVPPSETDQSRLILIIIGSAASGCLFALVFLTIVKGFGRNISCACQIEKVLGMPVYASLPEVGFANSDESPYSYLSHHPASFLAESLRTLLATILVQCGGRRGDHSGVITFTSTHKGEGKTTAAVWLATTAAQNGKKVLIIDADMRHPALHKAYGIGNARGLADYLSERLPLDDTIYKKHGSGVHIMTSKAIPVHALMLLSGERMDAMIRRLKQNYDLIIIDAPSSLLFSDACVLMRLSSQIIYVVRHRKTLMNDIAEAIRYFRNFGNKRMAVILSRVNDKKIIKLERLEMADFKYFNRKKS